MPAGGILVAASTDPAWTPLFLRAGALVMEAGGYLSHGAIVAREFGIPAIVNVQGIMRQVATGDVLEVDASRGTVRRLAAASSLGASDS
jgi:pyruvate,water dikinase